MAINFKDMSRRANMSEAYKKVLNEFIATGRASEVQIEEAKKLRTLGELATDIWKQKNTAAAAKLEEYERYKRTGGQGLSSAAFQSLVSPEFYKPSSLKEYSSADSLQAQLDQQMFISTHRNEGIFDVESNDPFYYSDDYLARRLTELDEKIAQSMRADEENAALAAQNTARAKELKALSGDYYHGLTFDELLDAYRGDEALVSEVVRDWLQLYSMSPEADPNAPQTWEELRRMEDDGEYEKWLQTLHDTWANTEWNKVGLTNYESQTGALTSMQAAAQKEQERRSTQQKYEEMAMSLPNWQELAEAPENRENTYKAGDVVAMAKGAEAFEDQQERVLEQQGLVDYYNNMNLGLGDLGTVLGWMFGQGSGVPETQTEVDKGYGYLTEQERTTYNILYNGYGPETAQQYLDAIEDTLRARKATHEDMELSLKAADPVMAIPYAMGSVAAGLANVFMLPAQIYETATGQDNPYSDAYGALRMQQTIRDAQSEALGGVEWANGVQILGQNPLQLAYGGVMSAADNTARLALGQGGALAAAGMQSASGSLYKNAGRDGMSGAAKLFQAAGTGLLEVGTEKIGLDKLFDTNTANVKKYLRNAIVSEMGEEIANDLGQEGLELLTATIFDHEAEIRSGGERAADILNTLLQTGISSLLMSGGSAMGISSRNKAAGKALNSQQDQSRLLEAALGMGKNTETYSVAKNIRNRQKSGKNVSLRMWGQLSNTMQMEVGPENAAVATQIVDEAIAARMVELGDTEEVAQANAPLVRKAAMGTQLNEQERKQLTESNTAVSVIAEMAKQEETEAAAPGKSGNIPGKPGKVKVTKSDVIAESTKVAKALTGGKTTSNVESRQISYQTDEAETTGELVRYEESADGSLEMVIKDDESESRVSFDDITKAEGSGVATLADYINRRNIQFTANEANTMLQAYQQVGGDAEEFIRGYQAAYDAGYAGQSVPQTSLSTKMAEFAASQGRAQQEQDEEARKALVRQRAQDVSQGMQGTVTWGGKVSQRSGAKTGSKHDLNTAMRGMTESQRATVEAIKQLAKVSGVNIVLFESTEAGMAQGVENGRYDLSTGTIFLDINAGLADAKGVQSAKRSGVLGYAMLRTLSHELTHYIETGSETGYAAFKQIMKDEYSKRGYNWIQMVNQKAQKSADAGVRLTRAGAEAEVVADAAEMMLQNATDVIANMAKQNATLAGKVNAYVNRFFDRVRGAFRNLTGGTYAKALMEQRNGLMRYTTELQEAWNTAFAEATGHAQAGVRTAVNSTQNAAETQNRMQEIEQAETQTNTIQDVQAAQGPAQAVQTQEMTATYADMVSDYVAGRELGTTRTQATQTTEKNAAETQNGTQEAMQDKTTVKTTDAGRMEQEAVKSVQEEENWPELPGIDWDEEMGWNDLSFGDTSVDDTSVDDTSVDDTEAAEQWRQDWEQAKSRYEQQREEERQAARQRAEDRKAQARDAESQAREQASLKQEALRQEYEAERQKRFAKDYKAVEEARNKLERAKKALEREKDEYEAAGIHHPIYTRQGIAVSDREQELHALEQDLEDKEEQLRQEYREKQGKAVVPVDRLEPLSNAVEDVQFSLRDSSGNEITLGTDEVQKNKKYVANMEPVVVLTGNPMAKESGVDFYTAGTAYFQSIGSSAKNEVLGTVVLNDKGIRHLINRKLTWRKTALLRAVKPVIEQGRILHVENDHNNKDTAVIGAVVQLDGQNYYMGVVVSQNDQRNNQYELHDAVIVQIEKKSADALTKTPSAEKNQTRRGIGNSSIAIILSDLANYNTKFAGEEQFSSRDQTETEKFKRWFGKSQVVNDDGTPKVMYHGTAQEFWTFEKRKANDALGRRMGLGAGKDKFYLSEYQGVGQAAANSAASLGKGTSPRVMELYVSAQKVMDRTEYDSRLEAAYDQHPNSRPNRAGYDYKARDKAIAAVDRAIRKEGYDGVWDRDSGEMFVYESNQIKSATDNVGTFDPKNPDIRYAQRTQPDPVSIREYLGELQPTSRMTETEKELLGRYQTKLKALQEKERQVAEQEKLLKEVHGEEITKTKNRIKIYRQQANRIARELAWYERGEGFARIMATSQKIVNDYMSHGGMSIAAAADRLDAEVEGLETQLKELALKVESTAQGQKIAFARGLFNQNDLNGAAKKLRDDFGSRLTIKEIANRLALAYGEIYESDTKEGMNRFVEVVEELAQDILGSSRFRYRSEVLTAIAEEVPTIGLSKTDKVEIRHAGLTLTQYKRMLSPYVKVVDGASDLSSYVSNAEAYGGQIASILGTDTEGDLAMALYNVIQGEKTAEQTGTFEGMSESESLTQVMAEIVAANLPMSTNVVSMDYLRKELMKYAGENTLAAEAVAKAIRSTRSVTRKASKVWLAAAQDGETSKKAVEYYRALDEQRRLTELREQKESLTEQLRSEAAKKLEEKLKEREQAYREREQKAREYRKTRDEVNKLRRGIGRKVKRLNALRVRETDQKHVPQEFQHVVDQIMQTFTESSLSKLAFSATQTASLGRTYRMLRELESDMSYYWDDEIETGIEKLQALGEEYTAIRQREGDVPSYFSLEGVELEMEILQGVDAVVNNVMQMIDSANDQFISKRNETFETYAAQTGEDLLNHADAKVLKGKAGDLQMMVDEWLLKGNVTPIYFFEHLKNGRIMDVFNEIREGQRKYAKIIRECQAAVQGAKKKYHYGKWVGDKALTLKTSQGHEITLTREQALWVYATAKREEENKLYQTEHLAKGGFEYKDTKNAGKGAFRQTAKPHLLNAADVEKINGWLTAEQKAYADELVRFMSMTLADHGNAASMDMFGYKKFNESYYFPFQTAADQLFQKGDEGAGGKEAGTGRVKNSGFTKKVQYKATTTLVMDDFTAVVSGHMQQMAVYSGMVQPIENFKRLMNHKVVEEDGTIQTIRALLGQKYGQAAQDYMTNLLRDLNGAVQGDERAMKGVNKLIGMFKRGAVAASASVVLQQPTAMVRAMSMISPKYFAVNPFFRPSKGLWDRMMAHSGTAVIKDMGKFDVGMGLTGSQYIADEHLNSIEAYRRLKAQSRLKGGAAAYNRFLEWLTAAPGKADQWTWCIIWQACENEQAALHPDMDRDSEAFLDLVGKRFDDVIDHTQVYDSVLSRSNLMRSANALHKMATSFMSEPTLSLNMLYDAAVGEHSKGKWAAIVGSVAASQVLAGAFAALAQAWSDDDDKRNWAEKYADRATGNIFDNLNPLGMIPYVSNIVDLISGYDVGRPDMEVIDDLITYGKNYFGKIADGEALTWKDTENFVGIVANAFGLPLKNIMREARRLKNAIVNTDWSAPDASNLEFVFRENVTIFGAETYSGKNSAYYERMISAMLEGDDRLVEDYEEYMLTSKMVSDATLTEGLRGELKERFQDGDITREEAQRFLLDNGLADDEKKAFQYVDKWEEGTLNYSVYNTVFEAMDAGNDADITAAVEELTANGWERKTVESEMRGHIKEAYMTGGMTQAEVRDMYEKHCMPSSINDESDWYWFFDEWDYGRENGTTEGYEKLGNLYEALDASNASGIRTAMDEMTRYGGYTQAEAESEAYSYLSEKYRDGNITKFQWQSLSKQYGGKDEWDENDWYWEEKKQSYRKQNGSTEGYSKYGDFHAAVESGDNLRTTINTYLEHGVSKSTLAGNITSTYKPLLIELYRTDRAAFANLQARILTAYEQLGYNRREKKEDIQKWLE